MKKITDEMLNDYIDNQLDAFSLNELKQSIIENDDSLKRLKALKTVHETLRDIKVYPAPSNFTEKVMNILLKQVKAVKPGINYFFAAIVSVFGVIITAVLATVWSVVDKQNISSEKIEIVETLKSFISDQLNSLGGFLSGNKVVFAGSVLTVLLLISILFVFDSHRNFKNKLNSLTH